MVLEKGLVCNKFGLTFYFSFFSKLLEEDAPPAKE
jgi:hypothetical protein